MCRGEMSILQRLSTAFPRADMSEYIGFYNLRQSSIIAGRPVCEQIYVHTKLMIVDDRIGIIGSANINDRSLLGDRDSEVACMIGPGCHPNSRGRAEEALEYPMKKVTLNGQSCEVSEFLHTLRVRLWAEHLGMLDQDELTASRILHQVNAIETVQEQERAQLEDAVECYDRYWLPRAAENTMVYEAVFPEMPCDAHKTIDDIREACGIKPGEFLGQNIYTMKRPNMDGRISDEGSADVDQSGDEATPKGISKQMSKDDLEEVQLRLGMLKGNVTRMPLGYLIDHDLNLSAYKDVATNSLPREVFC